MVCTAPHKRILFFSANAGTGHDSAARAIADMLTAKDASISCEVVNSYRFINQPYRTLMEDGYIPFIKFLPRLYRYLYNRKDRKHSILNLKSWLNRTTAPNFKRFIDAENPVLLVCTHAFPCGVLSEMKRNGLLSLGVLGVVTDFVVNPFWIYPETDMYMIASEDLKNTFLSRGVAEEKVKTTGIPINPRFNGQGISKTEARRKLQMDDSKPVLLIMGGGLGMNPAVRSLEILRHISTPVQAIIIMGKNERERFRMEQKVASLNGTPHNIRILGYVDNIYEYMKAADLLLTKPGGMTASEATAAALPMVLTDPLPGQENNNVQYLLQRGLAVMVNKDREIPGVVNGMLSRQDSLEEMASRARQFSVPDSAARAAEYIYAFMKEEKTAACSQR